MAVRPLSVGMLAICNALWQIQRDLSVGSVVPARPRYNATLVDGCLSAQCEGSKRTGALASCSGCCRPWSCWRISTPATQPCAQEHFELYRSKAKQRPLLQWMKMDGYYEINLILIVMPLSVNGSSDCDVDAWRYEILSHRMSVDIGASAKVLPTHCTMLRIE